MVGKAGKPLSRYWYARFTRAGEKRNVRIAPKVEIKGTPPTDANGHIDLRMKGDDAFEKSRKAALAALAKMRMAAKTTGKSKAIKDAETADLVNRYLQARTGKTIQSTRLDALLGLWKGLKRNYTPTAERVLAAKRTFKKFAEFARKYCRANGGKCETVDEITGELASEWFSALRDEYAWGTALPMWHLMRKSWIRWHIHASKNPFDNVVVRNREASAEKIARRPLSEEEIGRLFEVTKENPALHALVVCAACTGMRVGDVCRLRWDNIDLRNNTIEATTAKAGVAVTVPIFRQLREVLEELEAKRAVGDSPFVFPWAQEMYDHVNAKGLHDKQTSIIRMVKPYFARAIFPKTKPAPAVLANVKPKSIADVISAIDHAGFSEGKTARVREVYTRWRKGEKCCAIAAALNIARGQVSDYLKEAERVTGETYRPRINRKRARGKPTARDLMESTRAPRAIGKYSASLFGWHSLRHSFVVLALQNKVPVNDVSSIVGHGDAETTLKNYGNNSKNVVAERTQRQMRSTVLSTGKPAPLIEVDAIEAPVNKAPAQLPAPSKSVADRLRELKALADEGLITKSEYATQRKTIIKSV